MNQIVPFLVAAVTPHAPLTWPMVVEHAIRGTTTVLVLVLYLAYLYWAKPRIAKSSASGKWGILLNNLGDIIFLLILVPKIADHLTDIIKAIFV